MYQNRTGLPIGLPLIYYYPVDAIHMYNLSAFVIDCMSFDIMCQH